MNTRPRITLLLSPLDKALELTAKVLCGVIWLLTLYCLIKLPATIPIHYNLSGQIDKYGNKFILLIFPFFATAVYLGLTRLNQYPHIFNYLKEITEDNARQQYTLATRMLRFLKIAILIIFLIIIFFSYTAATGATNGPGAWFLPLAVGLLTGPAVVLIIQSHRIPG